MKERLNSLTSKKFNLVFNLITLQSSKIILEHDKNEWEIFISENKDLVFRKNNSLVGKITANLNIYSVLKSFKANEKSKEEIKVIFCYIYQSLTIN